MEWWTESYRSQFFDHFVGCPKTSQTDFLGKLSKLRISEQRSVTKEFMADVGFGGVHWFRVVSDVLSGVEDSEGQPSQKISGTQKSSNWTKSEASAVFQEVGDVLELRDVVWSVSAVLLKKREDVVELSTSVTRVKPGKLVIDGSPRGYFDIGVFNSRNQLSISVVGCDVRELLSSSSVDRVGEPWMIGIQFRSVTEDSVGKLIDVLDFDWEPRDTI